jgi:uncharacterized protein YfaS (alpha-2-macroglobulin family)
VKSVIERMIKNPGDTVSRYFYFKDENGTAFDPASITCKIVDPAGVTQGTPTLTKVATGQYSMDWNLPSDAVSGMWKIEVTATSGTYTETESFGFLVQAT